MQAYGQIDITLNKVITDPCGRTHHFYPLKALEDFLPNDTKLHLCQAVAHTSVYTGTKRQMISDIGSIDDKTIGVGDDAVIAIA